jgi:type II secretory pathway pseudopilin PulG
MNDAMHNPDRRTGRDGFTILETMIATIILLLLFFGLARVYAGGRVQMRLEDHRRQASAVIQSHLESMRRDTTYDNLPSLDGDEVDYAVGGITYTATTGVTAATPEPQATTIDVEVSWPEMIGMSTVTRTLSCTTILARGLTWN